MNKNDLVKELQFQFEEIIDNKVNQEQTRLIIDSVFDTIANSLIEKNNVDIVGFGKFEVVKRASRIGRNPHTSEIIPVPSRYGVKFKPFKKLKDVIKSIN